MNYELLKEAVKRVLPRRRSQGIVRGNRAIRDFDKKHAESRKFFDSLWALKQYQKQDPGNYASPEMQAKLKSLEGLTGKIKSTLGASKKLADTHKGMRTFNKIMDVPVMRRPSRVIK